MKTPTKPPQAGGPARTTLVYSTDSGRICPGCGQPQGACACRALAQAARPVPAADSTARVGRETKGRGGKTMTVVHGLPLADEALATLGKRLRQACGAGGTARDGVLEVQGDHVAKVLAWLQAEGFKAKAR